ncbi:Fanconi anemia core complex-associated protein 24 isoform X4 [Canis lupus baileyi]|uniref:Fanconi anemia core complex-associated protein 24 isoform X2 n=1 Tax=Canis lupus familiaris TaxID=9615 RepID=UPI0003ADA741|nr:Fanconi anemia core complex-associated protein 24 isoform X2 [Canis lupus familiaris]XP_022282053.1 Fanconi anemia core complex-associated protein 24 isoform X2 [Canis lupus familiaris]XP_025281008.1 Fanconi anemia core complex-associated protein 24 isoform X4 [Canis lupus dingo]XP_025281013.1 Fanconi anemia core complex-associated protein 24 isoform X4 [Canis lupus dingo]XP_035562634.1 Fanconi anemia core complex-associated protein 24 isoform X4 [Canis lupus dingo]XP_038309570.1 Fanconi an|eukprot:XP_005616831.1 Fanconi anemia core complex-associated protein 24 isoform X1 [Canis lupus familiaris]
MARNPAGSTGPVHVPIGHVVANDRWRGSQLVQGMQDLAFSMSPKPIWWQEMATGRNLFGLGINLQGIVIVEKTQMSEQYFSAIQKFTVLDLGMVLLPVASQMEASCLIIQLVQEQTKEPSKNPFLSKKRAPIPELSLLRTVQQIPGVGKVKALLLLQKFPSIQQLSNASLRELEPVVGPAVAQHIQAFFTQPR